MRFARVCVIVVAGAILALPACGSDQGACGPITDEPLDELSNQHVIAGSSVRFDAVAPTSGPHLSIVGPGGVYDDQLAPLEQVTLLESGKVLVQYRPGDVDADELAPFAEEEVAVAPNPELSTPLSLTAWQVRQECEEIDVAAIRSFASRYVGAPQNH